jgi:hypothetical protein
MFLYSYFCGLNDVFLAEHFNKYWKIGLEFNYFLINTRKLVRYQLVLALLRQGMHGIFVLA